MLGAARTSERRLSVCLGFGIDNEPVQFCSMEGINHPRRQTTFIDTFISTVMFFENLFSAAWLFTVSGELQPHASGTVVALKAGCKQVRHCGAALFSPI